MAELVAFVDCCRAGTPFPTSHNDGLRAQKVISAAMKAITSPDQACPIQQYLGTSGIKICETPREPWCRFILSIANSSYLCYGEHDLGGFTDDYSHHFATRIFENVH